VKVWIDGRIVEGGEARVPVTDHGLLYGDGIFEGIRVYGSRVFRLADHLRRFETSAKAIGLELPGGAQALEEIVLETVRAHGREEAYIRLLATRGEGALGIDPSTCPRPRIICIVDEVSLFPEDKLSRGLDMVTVSLRRPASDALDPRVKSLNYLNSVLARREAGLRGADDALILNAAGLVAEASAANVFIALDGALLTPPANDGALEGMTRASVFEMAAQAAIPLREKSLSRIDLLGADELFLTGTGARIAPVARLDGQIIGRPGERPITARLQRDFAEFVLRHGTPV
jgi:branched-chain amino acid aminotransferase